jgi:hypothetical protein
LPLPIDATDLAGSARRRARARATWASAAAAVLALGGCTLHEPTDFPAPADIETTLFLLGDAGEPDPRNVGAPLDSLRVQAEAAPARSIIVYLGDNVYPAGVPEEGHAQWADARRRVLAQVRAVPRGARGIFLPGNHDWADEGPFGLYSLRLQEQMIADMSEGRDVRMLPSNGCPGPVALDVGRMRLIILDTQWWLHPYIVRDAESDCAASDYASVTAQLRSLVAERGWRDDRGRPPPAHDRRSAWRLLRYHGTLQPVRWPQAGHHVTRESHDARLDRGGTERGSATRLRRRS